MSAILIFKLLSAPALILALTIIIRRYSPGIAGLVMGVPLVTGPISVFTAIEQGSAFAHQAAIGNLVGQVSTCLFGTAFAFATRRLPTWLSAVCGVGLFAAATALWNQFHWTLSSAITLLLSSLAVLALLAPKGAATLGSAVAPKWDLPARILSSMVFVFVITSSASAVGPQLSGLIAPFPVFVLILLSFIHLHHGAGAAAAMVRGIILGSLSFASFFVVTALTVERTGLVPTYGMALLASLTASTSVYARSRAPNSRIASR